MSSSRCLAEKKLICIDGMRVVGTGVQGQFVKPGPLGRQNLCSDNRPGETMKIKCGSGLAREGGVSVNSCLADIPPSRASPLPHGAFGISGIVGSGQKGAPPSKWRSPRHLLVQSQLTPLKTRTACGSKKLGGAMPGMYWSDTNKRQRSANADTTRDNWVLLAVAYPSRIGRCEPARRRRITRLPSWDIFDLGRAFAKE